ncbi:MAG: hypothetical protein ACYC6Y_19830, partial [Thermoguttaceae bacterium]
MVHQDSKQPLHPIDGSVWDKSAPERIRRAFRKGDPEAVWTHWRAHLAKRAAPVHPVALWPVEGNMLLGGSDEAGVDGETGRLLARLTEASDAGPSCKERSEAWLERVSSGPIDGACALESIAWAYALPSAAKSSEWTDWWGLLDRLSRLAEEASEAPLDGQPLVQQLTAGELSLTLAYLFPEIAPCQRAAKRARKVLSEGLLELVDGEGLPDRRILDVFRPLMACWTRCRILGRHMRQDCLSV